MKDDGRIWALGTVALVAAAGVARQGSRAFDLDAQLFGTKGPGSGDWQDRLDHHAEVAMDLFGQDDPHERAIAVAFTVGREARRIAVSETDLSKWLQGRYGRIWVRLGNLNPGADLKEVRKALLEAFRRK